MLPGPTKCIAFFKIAGRNAYTYSHADSEPDTPQPTPTPTPRTAEGPTPTLTPTPPPPTTYNPLLRHRHQLLRRQLRLRQQQAHLGNACQRQMTIDHTKVSKPRQSNFTVLVSVTDPALKTIANGGPRSQCETDSTSGFFTPTPGGTYQAQSGKFEKIRWHYRQLDRMGKDPLSVEYDRHITLSVSMGTQR